MLPRFFVCHGQLTRPSTASRDFYIHLFPCKIPRVSVRIVFLLLFAATLITCSTPPKRVVIVADGQRRVLETQAATVAQVLQEQKILLAENDLLEPPDYAPLDRNTTITIVRVEIKTETVTETIPFERKVIRDESLAEGKTRLAQLGANGAARVTYQLIYEDRALTTRREIARVLVSPATDEILAFGTQGTLAPADLRGTLVYLAYGNAWVMRTRSDDKRLLAATGDLDGRVFDLSPDGEFLLLTRQDSPHLLNSLWVVDTVLADAKLTRVPLDNLLYAQWNRDATTRTLAYSTGERTPAAPGWKAHNDLSIASLINLTASEPITLAARPVLSPSQPALYSWWGTAFDWSPDGRLFAYALANQVGLVNADTGARRMLKQFAYYRTRGDWIWTPNVSWSADARFFAATVHALPEGAGLLEDSQVFDIGVLARDDSVNLTLAHNVGMWSAPVWSQANPRGESKIAYGVALNPAETERSRYALWVMDRDASNKKMVFPMANEEGLELIRVAWSPDASQLAAIRDGDVWLYDLASGRWSQLTANGEVKWVRWK